MVNLSPRQTRSLPQLRHAVLAGYKKDDLTLKERTYHCSQCDVSIDRDVNAAINLKPSTAGLAESHQINGMNAIKAFTACGV